MYHVILVKSFPVMCSLVTNNDLFISKKIFPLSPKTVTIGREKKSTRMAIAKLFDLLTDATKQRVDKNGVYRNQWSFIYKSLTLRWFSCKAKKFIRNMYLLAKTFYCFIDIEIFNI